MTVKFVNHQPPVKIVKTGDICYVYICLNEKIIKEKYINEKNEEIQEIFYQYDYNEFCENVSKLDLDDIEANPQKYLEYDPNAQTEPDRLTQLELAVAELGAMVLGGAANG